MCLFGPRNVSFCIALKTPRFEGEIPQPRQKYFRIWGQTPTGQMLLVSRTHALCGGGAGLSTSERISFYDRVHLKGFRGEENPDP